MAEDFMKKTKGLIDWFLAIPGASISTKVEIADLRARKLGRGVVALTDIDEGEEILKIPLSAAITVHESDLRKLAPGIFEDLNPWLGPILVLIHEVLKGDKSFWKPYFDILPTDFNMPMFWTAGELEELQASPLRGRLGRQTVDETFEQTLIPLVRRHAKIFGELAVEKMTDSDLIALGHRMGALIMSYGFAVDAEETESNVGEISILEEDSPSNNSLVPMADMLNAQANNNAQLSQEDPRFLTMDAIRSIKQGEEILNDYGPLPRSELLRSYGYLHNSYAQYDVVELSQDCLVEACHANRPLDKDDLETRLEWLSDEDVLEEGYLITSREKTGSCFTDDLWRILRTLLTEGNNYTGSAKRDPSIEAAIYARSVKTLENALIRQLEQYQTTIAEDSNQLRKPGIEGRLQQAIIVRLSEKHILADAIQETKERSQNFIAVEYTDSLSQQHNKRQKTEKTMMNTRDGV